MKNNNEQISEQSKKFILPFINKKDIFTLLNKDISKKQILKFLKSFPEDNDVDISVEAIYKFICNTKNLSDKNINLILNDDVKLFLRIHSHNGTWYSDDYTPYCLQTTIKCSSPRMILQNYGYSCPECKNETSFIGIRLNESPLNYHKNLVNTAFGILENSINDKLDNETYPELFKTHGVEQNLLENKMFENKNIYGTQTLTRINSELIEIQEKKLLNKVKNELNNNINKKINLSENK